MIRIADKYEELFLESDELVTILRIAKSSKKKLMTKKVQISNGVYITKNKDLICITKNDCDVVVSLEELEFLAKGYDDNISGFVIPHLLIATVLIIICALI